MFINHLFSMMGNSVRAGTLMFIHHCIPSALKSA